MRNLLLISSNLLILIICVSACDNNRNTSSAPGLDIINPLEDALFPPEFPAPDFQWWSEDRDPAGYEVALFTGNKRFIIQDATRDTNWSPDEAAWDSLKRIAGGKKIFFSVNRKGKNESTEVSFSLSSDSVGAPILYRQMPIPFLIAEKKLEEMNFMLINVGSKKEPHVAMEGFPVCGNCHSFSADGSKIGLDLDAGLRDKGGYFVAPVKDTLLFNLANYTSWSTLEKRRTFGLFSKLSPDGRYVVTTVKDRVVIKNFPIFPAENAKYSQLFFAVNGHLAIYDRLTGELKELPGANLDEYVQTNATWTPDGEYIIFSRAKALPMGEDKSEIDVKDEDLINEFVERKRTFKYDLYRIPFNNGKGGKAEPIEGASDNGKSNYFPAVSPDGKWIVYCQAENFMLLMPDSELYIVPTEGGKARFLKCNTNEMNSWHSWSPNSRWIVFSSKMYGPYTDMLLAHIDKKGNASVPVLLEKAREKARVTNYPEFVNMDPNKTFVMDYDFVELAHIKMAIKDGEFDKARGLLYRFEKQGLHLFKQDCNDLRILCEQLGLDEKAQQYQELASQTVDARVFSN